MDLDLVSFARGTTASSNCSDQRNPTRLDVGTASLFSSREFFPQSASQSPPPSSHHRHLSYDVIHD